jgi:Fe-S cluster assembly ATP-binding protein
MLNITNLHVQVEDKQILKGLNLRLDTGKIYALMGPNGSGKSTLSYVIMGHPKYEVTQGTIFFNETDITHMPTDERAKLGVFLSFQYPKEIPGVSLSNFLRTAVNAIREQKLSILEFKKELKAKAKLLEMSDAFFERSLNEGFSGGEKKKSEILQLALLQPKLAILDETDSGLDIDALRAVSTGVNTLKSQSNTFLIITHYKRILEYIKPDHVFILVDGKIALEGKGTLVDELESKGYGWIYDE